MTSPRRPEIAATPSRQTRAIVVLARAPSAPGKTRLTAGLTSDQARALREALFLDTIDIARSLDVAVTVAYTPDDARDEMAAMVGQSARSSVDRRPGAALRPQRGDDLGARMLHAIIEAGAAGADTVVLIGSDLPTLPPSHLADAFTQLESGIDCVFGPADDGGYHLVGVRRGLDVARVFTGISWGTNRVRQESLSAAQAAGRKTVLIDPWFDVDLFEDLARVVSDARPGVAVRTRAWYNSFLL